MWPDKARQQCLPLSAQSTRIYTVCIYAYVIRELLWLHASWVIYSDTILFYSLECASKICQSQQVNCGKKLDFIGNEEIKYTLLGTNLRRRNYHIYHICEFQYFIREI